MNYYNEFDPRAAEWLRVLIEQKLIPDGIVDERSICDVRADELMGYTQCHFFAGIGGWPEALRIAGISENEPLWTGSCPCQDFSTAGKQKGIGASRDLWPVFFNLIKECRPPKVFGEQVENAIKHGWLDRVYSDLEAENYAVGAVVLGAHSVGGPHQRQRLYWGCERLSNASVHGHSSSYGLRKEAESSEQARADDFRESAGGCNDLRFPNSARGQCEQPIRTQGNMFQRSADYLPDSSLAENTTRVGCGERRDGNSAGQGREVQAPGLGTCGELADCTCGGRWTQGNNQQQTGGIDRSFESSSLGNSASDNQQRDTVAGIDGERLQAGRSGGNGNLDESESLGLQESGSQSARSLEASSGNDNLSGIPWSRYALIYCRDNKVRRVPAESVLQRVADGVSGELDAGGADSGFPLCKSSAFEKGQIAVLLKGYGNALCVQTASEFIKAFNGDKNEKPL